MNKSYEKLKDYIMKVIDPCVEPGEQAKQLREIKKNFPEYLSHLKKLEGKPENIKYLAVIFKAWNQIEKSKTISSFALMPYEELCFKFKNEQEQINEELALFNFQRAENLLEIAKSEKVDKYTDRHRLVEKGIGLVIDQCDNNDFWQYSCKKSYDIYAFIAKCYLFRSRLALPKGSSIPEKKMEALEKAWKWVKKTSLYKIDDADFSNSSEIDIECDFSHWGNQVSKEIDNLKIEIILEIKKWHLESVVNQNWFKDQFERFFLKNKQLDGNKPLHWILEDAAHEVGVNQKLYVFKPCNNNNIPLLYKTKAAFRNNRKEDFKKLLAQTIENNLNIPFSNHIWDEIIELIEKASVNEKMAEYWENAAIDAWKKCEDMEQTLQLSVQVRWYWARHRKLYDLAVKAAYRLKKINKAAEIADSQKSRPTIKLKNMETRLLSSAASSADQDRFKQIMEIETCFATDNYTTGFDLLKKASNTNASAHVQFKSIPDKWGAVHFYLAENLCTYIFVFTKDSCEQFQFSADTLWEKYICWEKEKRINKDAPDSFCALCKQFGEQFQDIFNWLDEKDVANILFIPHGFLHLVPLHAAKIIKKNKEKFLFELMPSLYLPAWSLGLNEHEQQTSNRCDGNYAFSKWDWNSVPTTFSEKWKNVPETTNNSAENVCYVINELEIPPELVVLYSHGKEDSANPYQSSLLMNDSNLTHEMILHNINPDKLKGSNIILTACETDLASGDMGPADEHLSLANAFLTKNAKAVLGTLYECAEEKSLDFVDLIKKDARRPIYKLLQNQQKKWLKNNNFELEDIAVYRVMGFPEKATAIKLDILNRLMRVFQLRSL